MKKNKSKIANKNNYKIRKEKNILRYRFIFKDRVIDLFNQNIKSTEV
jgi:hypothetical protein